MKGQALVAFVKNLSQLAAFYGTMAYNRVMQRAGRADIDSLAVIDYGKEDQYTINSNEVEKMVEDILDESGKEDKAALLNIALQYCDEHDNMQGVKRMLEEIVSDNLSKEQIKNLRDWDQKIDAAIAVGVFMPEAREPFDKQIEVLSKGRLTLEDIDEFIHLALDKHVYDPSAGLY